MMVPKNFYSHIIVLMAVDRGLELLLLLFCQIQYSDSREHQVLINSQQDNQQTTAQLFCK